MQSSQRSTILATKPNIAVPVFDPALQPLAEKVVATLNARGAVARVWLKPELQTYVMGYQPSADERPGRPLLPGTPGASRQGVPLSASTSRGYPCRGRRSGPRRT